MTFSLKLEINPWAKAAQPCRKGVYKYLIPTSPWYGERHQVRSYCICSVVLCLVAELLFGGRLLLVAVFGWQ